MVVAIYDLCADEAALAEAGFHLIVAGTGGLADHWLGTKNGPFLIKVNYDPV